LDRLADQLCQNTTKSRNSTPLFPQPFALLQRSCISVAHTSLTVAADDVSHQRFNFCKNSHLNYFRSFGIAFAHVRIPTCIQTGVLNE
jgi:hypothetical protein